MFAWAFALALLPAPSEISVANATIVTQAGATEVELHAAEELQAHLSEIIGKPIPLRRDLAEAPAGAIVVGQGSLARRLLPAVKWESLGAEQTLVRTSGDKLVVAGGRPRGTLYAVYRLLGEKCGVRWWTPWAKSVPHQPKLKLPVIDVSEKPAFEYRDTYWFHAFDGDWSARNFNTGFMARVLGKRGGRIEYQGFVHTYFGLAPPEKLFASHPEWYSLINGKRTFENAQLCTTNPALRDYVVEQVREQLRKNPRARIASISQNDCFNPCQCPDCRALADRESSDSALVLDLVNYVAEKLEKEFPDVAFDTLAYQWSRRPPKAMRPRSNVIVRLCSIECNFAFPLDAPENASFGDDIRGWSKLTDRLYVWNYTTDFAHYLQPHPDFFTLAPTIRFFAANGVKGLFEQGAYQSNGGGMAELKAWLIAQLLWDPSRDSDKLIGEFLTGYYGPENASAVRRLMELLAREAKGWNLTFASPVTASFLRYEVVDEARRVLESARATRNQDHSWRMRQLRASLDYVYLCRWQEFRREAERKGNPWPYPSRTELARRWLETVTGTDPNLPPPAGWTPVTYVNESGLTPAQFVERLGPEPPKPVIPILPKRPSQAAPPEGLSPGIDLQDDLANLWREPDGAELRPDPSASDGIAAWMPATHHEWAFQVPISRVKGGTPTGKCRVFAVVRLDHGEADDSRAFTTGVYDTAQRKDLSTHVFTLRQLAPGYKAFDLGTFEMNPNLIFWVAPTENPKVQGVWVDRIYLVRA